MPYKQEDDFKMLKNRTLGIAFNTSEGQTFTFHDLNSRAKVLLQSKKI